MPIARVYDNGEWLDLLPAGANAEQAAALEPGDPGDLKGTVGSIVTNIKPGMIDIRVRGIPGDGTGDYTDEFNDLIDNADGAEIRVPDGVYRAAPILQTGTRITGYGTIKAPDSHTGQGVLETSPTCTGDIAIMGVTIDANSACCGVFLADSGIDGALVDSVTILNPGSVYNYDIGLRFIYVTRLIARRVTVYGGVIAINGYNPEYSTFEDCLGVGQSGNAFGAVAEGGALRGNQWIGLRARDCGRIGLELWPGGGWFEGGVVERCDIENTGLTADQMGLSLVAIRNGRASLNRAYSPTTTPGYGYELGGESLNATNNLADGYESGYVLNNTSYCVLRDNRSLRALTGFGMAGADPLRGHVFSGNVAQSYRDIGFLGYGDNAVGSGGFLYDGNSAIRDLAWAGDGAREVFGFKISADAAVDPITVINNIVDWRETSTTVASFNPYQFISDAADMVGTKHRDNKFFKRNSAGTSWLNTTNGSAANTAIGTLTGNTRTNYLGVTTDMNDWNAGPWTN